MKITNKGKMMPSDNNMKAKKAMFTIFLILATVLAMSCKECPTEPDYNIYLSAEDVFCTSVVLNVTLPDSGHVNQFALERNDSTIITLTCYDDDTLITDGDLTPDTDYTYRVRFLKDGKTRAESEQVTVHTMDTTSHDIFNWDIDTLGIMGEINDLYVSSNDYIWAVGEIIVDDPDSSFNGTGRETFNATRWDGNKWNLVQIGNIGMLYSVRFFSENDIWVSSGFPEHWDGSRWTLYHLQDMGLGSNVSTEQIWASSPDNIYFVGRNGSIVHYNGSTFTKMESGTSCDLEDVYGIDENHIWAVGTETDNSQSVILFYNGTAWKTLHDTNQEKLCWSNSVWTDSPYLLFLNGGSGRYLFDLVKGDLSKYESAGRWFGYSIHGSAYNDIFASGMGSEILHFNGSTWHLYTEIKEQFDDYGLIKTIKVKDDLIVAGGLYYTGLYGLPVVIRGYR